MRICKKDIRIHKADDGYYVCELIINDKHRYWMKYIFYTKKEAINRFYKLVTDDIKKRKIEVFDVY